MKALGSWSRTPWNAKLLTSSEAPCEGEGIESHEVPCIDPWLPQKGVKYL